MKLNRRDFNQTLSLMMASSSSFAMSSVDSKKLLVPSQYSGNAKKRFPNNFIYFDFKTLQEHAMEIPLAYSHSAFTVGNSRYCLVVEKDGPKGCLVDLKNKKVEKLLQATPKHVFSGHILIDETTSTLITTEFDYPTSNIIVVRDLNSFEEKYRIQSPSIRPHEMKWLNSERSQFAMGHYGKFSKTKKTDIEAEISVVDLKIKRITKRFRPIDKNSMTCHLDVVGPNKILTGTLSALTKSEDIEKRLIARLDSYDDSKMKPLNEKAFHKSFDLLSCPLYLVDIENNKVTDVTSPEIDNHLKWNLTVKTDPESSTIAVTHVYGGHVSFWDANSMKLKTKVRINFPTGVYLHENNWLVLGENGQLLFIDKNTLKVSKSRKFENFIGAASHLEIV